MSVFTSALVVDDSRTTLQIVTKLLQDCGIPDIDQATNGASALGMIRAKRYPLICSDVNMENIHGVELLRAVRKDLQCSDICFILMTTMRNREVIEAAKLYQADAIIMKPFTSDVLKCKLADLEKLRSSAN